MIPNNYAKDFLKFQAPRSKELWELEFNSMARHTQKKDAESLIKKRRPNEPDDVHKYRMENFEHITHQAIMRAISNLQRYFSRTTATIKTDDTTTEYLSEPNFDGVDFKTYVTQKVVNRMIEDPNGMLVWFPKGGVSDTSRAVDLEPILVLSKDIIHYDKVLGYLTFETSEKSTISTKDGDQKIGTVYNIVSDDGYYKYFQTGTKGTETWELNHIYKHEFERLPVIILGGESAIILKGREEFRYLTSYFGGFVPFANEALRQFSDHQAIMITSGYPIREMEAAECLTCDVKGFIKDDKGNKSTCPDCQGSRQRFPVTPYGVLYKESKGGNALNSGQMVVSDSLKFHSPDVSILKYSGELWEKQLLLAEKALNLNYINEAQSGIAKEIDRENLDSMLDRIGTNIYQNIARNSILIIQSVRNNKGSNDKLEIQMPYSFRSRSEFELVSELNGMVKDDTPHPLLIEATKELVRKRYAGNDDVIKAVEFLAIYDPFFVYTIERRSTLYATNALLYTEYRTSLFSYNSAMKIAASLGDDFSTMDYAAFEKAMDKIIKPKIGVPPNGGVS